MLDLSKERAARRLRVVKEGVEVKMERLPPLPDVMTHPSWKNQVRSTAARCIVLIFGRSSRNLLV